MFNSLFNSLFGKSNDNSSNRVEDNTTSRDSSESDKKDIFDDGSNVIAVLLDDDKDWLFVEKDVEELSDITDKATKELQLVPFRNIFSHLGSISENDENCLLSANLPSLYPNSMDASWILTPPECFSSVSSIQLESSPLENLLIEHPSMSVYYNFHHRGNKTVTNGDTIDDLVVLELSEKEDNDDEQVQRVPTKNRDRKNNKKSRTSGNPRNIAIVLVKKTSNPKPQEQRKSAQSKSAFERNNKLQLLRHAPKRTTVINQPSSRMMISNKKN